MRERTRVRKGDAPEADPKPANRLTDIVVSEVSIVDRAANQRKFLVVKDAPGTPATPPTPAAPPAAQATPATPAAWSISPELKMKLTELLKSAAEKINALAKRVEAATASPGASPPSELPTLLSEISGLFSVSKADEGGGDANADVEKAGKKISAARLAQLISAHEMLTALIAEVQQAPKEEEGDASAAPLTPAVPAQKSAGTDPPEEPAEIKAIKDGIATLTDMMAKVTQVFEGQNARIEALAKSRGQSQQIDVETARPAATPPVIWDMDMNKPLVRDEPARRF